MRKQCYLKLQASWFVQHTGNLGNLIVNEFNAKLKLVTKPVKGLANIIKALRIRTNYPTSPVFQHDKDFVKL